jgi:hypothetical protein
MRRRNAAPTRFTMRTTTKWTSQSSARVRVAGRSRTNWHPVATRYNHMAGLKIVGEIEPSQDNRVELAAEIDDYGLRIPKVTFSHSGTIEG